MAKPKPDTISSAPLFRWFDADKSRRRTFREAGYSDGRITNWKKRGIPRAELGPVAAHMGLTYEEYAAAAGMPVSSSSHGLRLQIEEAEAVKRLRHAHPDWRRYVLGLAMVDNRQTQEVLLTTMRQAVPDYKVEAAYGDAPHVKGREPVFTTLTRNEPPTPDGRQKKRTS